MGQYQRTVSVRLCCLGPCAGLLYPIWQIYSTTRIFTVIAVTQILVGLDVTARYNCEVCMFDICFICGCDLIGHDPKVETVFELVSKPLRCT